MSGEGAKSVKRYGAAVDTKVSLFIPQCKHKQFDHKKCGPDKDQNRPARGCLDPACHSAAQGHVGLHTLTQFFSPMVCYVQLTYTDCSVLLLENKYTKEIK